MEQKIVVNHHQGLDVTCIHAIVNEACRFYSSTEILYNNQFLNVKSMKNSFHFFQQPLIGEITIECTGYDEFYAIQQMISVIKRYLYKDE